MMSQKTIILTVVLFAIIVIGMFVYAHMRSAELDTVSLVTYEVYS